MASVPQQEAPTLRHGDRMTQPEFHRLYAQMPEHFKAELIGGIVHVASPLLLPHGSQDAFVGGLLLHYRGNTPGTQSAHNTTVILGMLGEPQPDNFLRIAPECGGQSRTEDNYVLGAPELLAEIAWSSQTLDLNARRLDYQHYGVREYLVVAIPEQRLRWFDLRSDRELQPDADGVYRIRCFPGLWLHGEAVLNEDYPLAMSILNQGLATPEHAAFVKQLAEARARHQS